MGTLKAGESVMVTVQMACARLGLAEKRARSILREAAENHGLYPHLATHRHNERWRFPRGSTGHREMEHALAFTPTGRPRKRSAMSNIDGTDEAHGVASQRSEPKRSSIFGWLFGRG